MSSVKKILLTLLLFFIAYKEKINDKWEYGKVYLPFNPLWLPGMPAEEIFIEDYVKDEYTIKGKYLNKILHLLQS